MDKDNFDQKEEIWKDIPGHEGVYQISTFGRVKSLERVLSFETHNQYTKHTATRKYPEKLLTPRVTKGGYLRVQLQKKDFYIHRLMAETFIRHLEDKEEINHLDGNKENNHLSNLEIVTRVENQNHAYDTGLNKRFQKAVRVKVNGVKYNSYGEASRDTGIPKATLVNALNKKIKNPKKYFFTIELW